MTNLPPAPAPAAKRKRFSGCWLLVALAYVLPIIWTVLLIQAADWGKWWIVALTFVVPIFLTFLMWLSTRNARAGYVPPAGWTLTPDPGDIRLELMGIPDAVGPEKHYENALRSTVDGRGVLVVDAVDPDDRETFVALRIKPGLTWKAEPSYATRHDALGQKVEPQGVDRYEVHGQLPAGVAAVLGAIPERFTDAITCDQRGWLWTKAALWSKGETTQYLVTRVPELCRLARACDESPRPTLAGRSAPWLQPPVDGAYHPVPPSATPGYEGYPTGPQTGAGETPWEQPRG